MKSDDIMAHTHNINFNYLLQYTIFLLFFTSCLFFEVIYILCKRYNPQIRVGIRIPEVTSIRMVQSTMNAKWSGNGHQNVWFTNCSRIQMYGI